MSTTTKLLRTTLLSLTLMGAAACAPEIGGGVEPSGPDAGSFEPGDPEVCDEAVAITFERRPVTPDILLVLDRSGSMNDPLVNGNITSKWDVMRNAMATIVADNGAEVNFGLMMFPSNNECAVGGANVSPAINNVGPILGAMNANGSTPNNGGTPTHQSLQQAQNHYNSAPANPDGRIVILATDGIPTCGSSTQASVSVIQSLLQSDIKTYVLGFGFGNADVSGLLQMALAGGTNQLYSADSPGELNIALDSILGDVTVPSCDFELQQTPANADDINVTINGVELTRDDPNGWSYDDASNTITLNGASCEAVQSGGTNGIEVDLGCEGEIID